MQDSTLNQQNTSTNPTFPTDQSMSTPPSLTDQPLSVPPVTVTETTTTTTTQPADTNPTFPTETPQDTGNGGGVPPDSGISTPPQTDFAPPSPRRRALIPTILGLVLLVVGVGAGLVLTQQQQLIKQKASECSDYCAGGGQCSSQGGHTVGSRCSGGSCDSGTSPCLIPAAVTATPTPSGPFCTGTSDRGQCPASWTWAPPGSAGAAACVGSHLGRCCQPGDNACTPPTSSTTPTTAPGQTCNPGSIPAANGNYNIDAEIQCGTCPQGAEFGRVCYRTSSGTTQFSQGDVGCVRAHACGYVATSGTECYIGNTLYGDRYVNDLIGQCHQRGYTGGVGEIQCINGNCQVQSRTFLGCGNEGGTSVTGPSGCANCWKYPDGHIECHVESSSCSAKSACQGTAPTTPPTTTTTPTNPPGSTTPSTAQCQAVKAYDTNWNLLTTTQLSALKAGDKVRFTVTGTTTSGVFDKARFTINGTLRPEVTTTKPAATQEFYDEYTIPVGVTSFTVTAQIHHAALNTWN